MTPWRRIRHARPLTALVGAIALGAMLVACGGGDDDAGDDASVNVDPATLATTVNLAMKENSFSLTRITVATGKDITFELNNEGKEAHNMSVNVEGKDTVSNPDVIKAGQAGKLAVTFSKAGTYDFKCDLHPTEMLGKITVK